LNSAAWAACRIGGEKAGPPLPPDTDSTLSLARYESAYLPKPKLPGADQKPPTQEKGERKPVPQNRVWWGGRDNRPKDEGGQPPWFLNDCGNVEGIEWWTGPG
jgi:hypothetical protein